MQSRRKFLFTGIAAPLAGATPKYDLVLQGGRVIDVSQNIDRVADVAILGDRIAAIGPNIIVALAPGTQVIDARGMLGDPRACGHLRSS